MSEPTPDAPGTDDELDRLLRAAAPTASPQAHVRARHRAELDAAIARGARRRRPSIGARPVAAAVAALALLAGGVALASRDDDRTRITAGERDGGTDVDPAAPWAPPLSSAACDGASLPFVVPVGEELGGPAAGPAPGAPAPDVEGQLIAHWSSPDTAVEVRWPADVAEEVLGQLGQSRQDMEARLAEGTSASTYTAADLHLDVADGPDPATSGVSVGFRSEPPVDGTYEIVVTGYEHPAGTKGAPDGPRPIWGEGLCSTVQLTVAALDGRADVRGAAEALYEALLAPGGPLVATRSTPELVVARTEAGRLEPPSECNLPPGIDQDPVRIEDVSGPGPFATADEALAAYLDTLVATDEGPFGPEERATAPTGGYTAISLPDGRVGFRWPDAGNGVIGHFVAEQGPDGWSITRTEGPSC